MCSAKGRVRLTPESGHDRPETPQKFLLVSKFSCHPPNYQDALGRRVGGVTQRYRQTVGARREWPTSVSAHQRVMLSLAERPRVLSERAGRGWRKSVLPRKSYYGWTLLRHLFWLDDICHFGRFFAVALPCAAADSIGFPWPGL